MAKKPELLVEAKELDIKDADSLSYNDLKKAVTQARKAKGTPKIKGGDNPDTNSKGKKKAKEFFETENGKKFSFTNRTPEKFRFNGVIKSKAEWLQDEDAMEMLIYGNCMYIKELN